MFRSLYVPLDGSAHADAAAALALTLARVFGGRLTASHVFAARMHESRFRQMEFTLQEQYRQDAVLEKQRDVHEDLIGRGLKLISDSYLQSIERQAGEAAIPFAGRSLEGRNFVELVREVHAGDADLVVMGAKGMGATEDAPLGSVCERMARRLRRDLWVVKDPRPWREKTGAILVAIDGSAYAYAGLQAGLKLARPGHPGGGRSGVRSLSTTEMGTPIFVLSGGDPANRPDLTELVRFGKGLGLRMATIPAATERLTRDLVHELKDAGLDQLAVSLDLPRAEMHDAFRGVPGAYRKTLEGVEWAHAAGFPSRSTRPFAATRSPISRRWRSWSRGSASCSGRSSSWCRPAAAPSCRG